MGVLAPLFAKTRRLATLFNNINNLRRLKITNAMLFVEIGKAMLFPGLVLIVWFAVNPPKHRLVEIASQQEFYGAKVHTITTYQNHCDNDMRFVGALAAFILGYVLYGSSLAYQTRNIPEVFNESKSIGMSLYFILIMGALLIALLTLVKTNMNAVAVLLAYGLIITVLTVWATIFGHKLLILVKGQGDVVATNHTSQVPQTVQVAYKTQEADIVLLQSENLQLKAELKEALTLIAKLKGKAKAEERHITVC
jgi:hypothetical protein